MGRSYYVDESVQSYFTRIAHQKHSVVTGLLIGQCSMLRDYVVLAVQTPPKEDPREEPEKKEGGRSKPEDIDEEWFCIHASQVSRMLPGGFLLVGVFMISNQDVSKEPPNILRKLIFATEKFGMKNKLWNLTDEDVSERAALQISSSTNKIVCRTFDVKDPKSSAKPAEWKYQSSATPWLLIESNLNVDLSVPLPASTTYQEQQKCTRIRLAQWAQEIEASTILFNGRLRDGDGDLLEEQKKGRCSGHSGGPIISATLLSPSDVAARCSARVQICNSAFRIQGVVRSRGFICSNKSKVRDAVRVIKRDFLNTMSDRCDVMFEDLVLNGSQSEWETLGCTLPLPRRVFVPIPGTNVTLCDYIMGEEGREDVQNHFLEMVDQDVNYQDLDFVEEKTTRFEQTLCKASDAAIGQKLRKEIPSSKFPHSLGMVMAAAVVLVAVLVYLLQ